MGYCFGKACPCGNDDPGAGCSNSTGAGALLSATGLASVASDDLDLLLSGMPPGNIGLVYLGEAKAQLPFGDGLRCVGAGALGLIRLPAGAASAGGSLGSTAVISTAGLTAGSSWNFQGWYRDPGGLCGSGYNLSNALSIVIIP